LGLRLEPDAFFEQIEEALVVGGWRRAGEDVIRTGPADALSV
jgi:hypothetical protein